MSKTLQHHFYTNPGKSDIPLHFPRRKPQWAVDWQPVPGFQLVMKLSSTAFHQHTRGKFMSCHIMATNLAAYTCVRAQRHPLLTVSQSWRTCTWDVPNQQWWWWPARLPAHGCFSSAPRTQIILGGHWGRALLGHHTSGFRALLTHSQFSCLLVTSYLKWRRRASALNGPNYSSNNHLYWIEFMFFINIQCTWLGN